MPAITDALAIEKRHGSRYEAIFHEDWYQGAGVYGGMQAGIFLEAFTDHCHNDRRARKISVQFCSPATAGPVTIYVRQERQGAYVTHLSGRMTNERGVVAIAAATFAKARHTKLDRNVENRALVASARDFPPQQHQPIIPEFAKHFEFRFCRGDFLTSRSDKAELAGFIAPKERHAATTATLACLLDAWPPALFATLDKPRPTASSDFLIQFMTPFDTPSAHYFYESQTRWVHEGYAEEDAVLTTDIGVPLARIRQTRVVF